MKNKPHKANARPGNPLQSTVGVCRYCGVRIKASLHRWVAVGDTHFWRSHCRKDDDSPAHEPLPDNSIFNKMVDDYYS